MKYTVYFAVDCTLRLDVEADSREEANKKARVLKLPYHGIFNLSPELAEFNPQFDIDDYTFLTRAGDSK